MGDVCVAEGRGDGHIPYRSMRKNPIGFSLQQLRYRARVSGSLSKSFPETEKNNNKASNLNHPLSREK